MEELLRRQWESLLAWLDQIEVAKYSDMSTGLGDWTVGDLVAHLGLSLSLAADVGEASADVDVLSIGQYVAAYPPAADEIAAMTQQTRAALGPDTVRGLREIGERVWQAVARYDQARVLARRGAMGTSDYLATRLIELVVHGDDLWRVLGLGATPVIPEALRTVSTVLADAYRERTGVVLNPADDLAWVRAACGRQASDDPALPLL
ncbi:MAG: maleylpyruvate isomerase N-terminal domain-containing protein [Actinomycetota bacterium]|nr:maleylpyruvate isomerase N-terminal domain-containing protein [Actinomycetota bacterium]